MKLLLRSMAVAFWVELASLFVAGLFSSSESLGIVKAIWALHGVADLLAWQIFANAGRSAVPWYILFLAIVQWVIYVFAFFAVGGIAQRWMQRPPINCAPPNGGPVRSLGNSGDVDGPPSVS